MYELGKCLICEKYADPLIERAKQVRRPRILCLAATTAVHTFVFALPEALTCGLALTLTDVREDRNAFLYFLFFTNAS